VVGADLEHRALGAEPEILDPPNLRETARTQLANAAYRWDPEKGRYAAKVLEVLTLEGTQVKEMTAFMTPQVLPRFGLPETLSPDVG
jgi:hypothetical protein